MPLKIICEKCGELMFESSMKKLNLGYTDLSIPTIIRDKLGSECPGCGRKFTAEDLENWTVKISGLKATRSFYEENARGKRHGELEELSVTKIRKRGRPRR